MITPQNDSNYILYTYSDEGVITSTPTSLSKRAMSYYFEVDTTAGDVDISNLPASFTGNNDFIPLDGTKFTFSNSGTNSVIYNNLTLGSDGDTTTLIYFEGSYKVLSYNSSTPAGKVWQGTTQTNGQVEFILSENVGDINLVKVFVLGATLTAYSGGFTIVNNLLTIHSNYKLEVGDKIEVFYT